MKKVLFISFFALLLMSGCGTRGVDVEVNALAAAKECVNGGGYPVSYYYDGDMSVSRLICVFKDEKSRNEGGNIINPGILTNPDVNRDGGNGYYSR